MVDIFSTSGKKLLSVDAVNLHGANLSCADLGHAGLYGVSLRSADLSYADLSHADLYGADLSHADLNRADLRLADLSRSDLYGANLEGANLEGANLRGANLRGASMCGASLRGADLHGADLRGATGINKFLVHPLHMLLDQPGKIRAYKLVTEEGFSPFRHADKLEYKLGETIEVQLADTDPSAHCGEGISLASLDWVLKEYVPGWRILVCEFEAKDIACIPTASDGKFRVFRCKVVGEKSLKELGIE